jgi:hypothetical protein
VGCSRLENAQHVCDSENRRDAAAKSGDLSRDPTRPDRKQKDETDEREDRSDRLRDPQIHFETSDDLECAWPK